MASFLLFLSLLVYVVECTVDFVSVPVGGLTMPAGSLSLSSADSFGLVFQVTAPLSIVSATFPYHCAVSGSFTMPDIYIYAWNDASKYVTGSALGHISPFSGITCATSSSTGTITGTFGTPVSLSISTYYIIYTSPTEESFSLEGTTGYGLVGTTGAVTSTWTSTSAAGNFQMSVGLTTGAAATGDPHFSGFLGETFDFMGKANYVFSLFSSPDLTVNALFVSSLHPDLVDSDTTYMGQIGIKQADSSFIEFSRENDPSMYPFQLASADGSDNHTQTYILNNGGVAIWTPPSSLTVAFPEYMITMNRLYEVADPNDSSICEVYMRISMSITKEFQGPAHGLIGQTVIPMDQRHVGNFTHLQGDGKIEGIWKDYIIQSGDLFGDDFTFSMHNKTAVEVAYSKQTAFVEDMKQ